MGYYQRGVAPHSDKLDKAIREQEQWIEQCGGSLAGYVEKYGSADDPEHYGNGGEAIYAADTAELAKLRKLAGRT